MAGTTKHAAAAAWLLLVLLSPSWTVLAQTTAVKQPIAVTSIPKVPQLQTSPESISIFSNGTFGSGWVDTSRGCIKCDFQAQQPHAGSDTTASLHVASWGELALMSTTKPFASNGVLDFWAKGSGLALVSIFIRDDINRRWSKDVRLAHGSSAVGVTLSDYDDDNWMRVTIDLNQLMDNATTNFNGGWTSVVLRDVSGLGFFLRLNKVQLLYSGSLLSDFAISSFDPLLSAASTMSPLYNDDYPSTMATPMRYIMRLRSTVQLPAVHDICSELQGTLQGINQRFKGACVSKPANWNFLTVDVASSADLRAMRAALSDKVAYFEQDLLAYALPVRGLRIYRVDDSNDDSEWAKPVTSADLQEAEGSPAPNNNSSQVTPAMNGTAADNGTNLSNNTASEPPEVVVSGSPSDSNATNNIASIQVEPEQASSDNSNFTATIQVEPQANKQATQQSSDSPNDKATIQVEPELTADQASSNDSNFTATVQVEPVDTQPRSPAATEGVVTTQQTSSADGIHTTQTKTTAADGTIQASETATIQSTVSSWGLDRIDQVNLPLDGRYSPGNLDGRGVHVYVVDTGVRSTHQDFSGRVGEGTSFVTSSPWDDNGHGSHVSGIALGGYHGVAKSAILHPVKVLQSDGSGSFSTIINGLQWVRDHKVKNKYSSAVVVMSLGGPRSASLNDAVEDLTRNGITVVVAAGNNRGADACTMSPASATSAIAVGSSTDRDAMSDFSNIGRCLSLFAPGSYIVSASYKSDTGEATMSGTSMAAPHVAGAVALYLQLRPAATASEVKSALQKAAVNKYLESSSPQLLLDVIEQRLRAAAPGGSSSTPATPSTPTTTKKPTPTPSPSPAPAKTSRPTSSVPSIFPSMPSICSTCPWCMFCN